MPWSIAALSVTEPGDSDKAALPEQDTAGGDTDTPGLPDNGTDDLLPDADSDARAAVPRHDLWIETASAEALAFSGAEVELAATLRADIEARELGRGASVEKLGVRIAESLQSATQDLQLILICGRNERLVRSHGVR